VKDNDLIRLFRPIIINGLVANGYDGVIVKQSYQPTQQGTDSEPAVYFQKIGDKRYGFLQTSDVWDEDENVMVHTETQQYETTFQFSALVLQSPLNPYSYTAADLVNEVAAIMQSNATQDILLESDVGILRVMNVVNPFFTDDFDKFEAAPLFELVLTHKQTRVTEVPVIQSTELNINRV